MGIKTNDQEFLTTLHDEIISFLKDRHRTLNERIGCRSIIRSMAQSAFDNSGDGDVNCFPSISYETNRDSHGQASLKQLGGGDSYGFRCDSLNKKCFIAIDLSRISLLQTMAQSCIDGWDRSKINYFLSNGASGIDDSSKLAWWDRPLWAWKWDELVIGNGSMISIDMAEKLTHILRLSESVKVVVSDLHDFPKHSFEGDWKFRMILRTQSSMRQRHNGEMKKVEIKQDDDMKQARSEEAPLGEAEDGKRLTEPSQTSPLKENSAAPEKDRTSLIEGLKDSSGLLAMPADAVTSSNKELVFDQSSEDSCTLMTQSNDPETMLIMSESPTCVLLGIPPSQVDSQGVDLGMLSQLPPELRAEARLALAIQDQKREKKRRRPPSSSQLYQWLSTSSSASTTPKSALANSSMPSAKKVNQTIKDFFF